MYLPIEFPRTFQKLANFHIEIPQELSKMCQIPEPVVRELVAVRNHQGRGIPSSVLLPGQVPSLCPVLVAYLVPHSECTRVSTEHVVPELHVTILR